MNLHRVVLPNPFENTIHVLLGLEFLLCFHVVASTRRMLLQIRALNLPKPAPWDLTRLHRKLFPRSALRRVRGLCRTLALVACGISGIYIHKNAETNRAYLAQMRQQLFQLDTLSQSNALQVK